MSLLWGRAAGAVGRGRDPLGALLVSPFAFLLFRPWFDRAALAALVRGVFPASRLWAAAEEADHDPARLVAMMPALAGRRAELAAPLARLAGQAREAADAERRFAAAIAAGSDADEAARRDALAARRRANLAYLGGRFALAVPAARARVAGVRWEVPDPAQARARLAPLIADPRAAFAAPTPLPAVVASAAVAMPWGRQYWLGFASPSPWIGSDAVARVYEPARPDAPTLVYCHGVAVEPEAYGPAYDEALAMVARGLRVIRLVHAWHGPRRLKGTWSGEPFFARAPIGTVEQLAGSVREAAVLVAWARAQGSARVALGGVSLGALTAQLACVHARAWPAACRPDALLLAGTSDRLDRIALEGSLTGGLGMPRALAERGWDAAALEPLRPLVDPLGEPCCDPAAIIVVLGTADDVTPYDGGVALADRWGVPEANRYRPRRGHFSLSLALVPEPAPLARLADMLGAVPVSR